MAPRTNQKNRTRAALLSATRALMAEGQDVTLARVAERAKIGRATVYRYFSDPGVLALEAALDLEVMPTADLLAGIEDVRARVHAVARYYLEFSHRHETYFRRFLAEAMRTSLEEGHAKRGARRVVAFSEALDPVRTSMAEPEFQDLTRRLAMTSGMEQFIILEDILRVDRDTGYRLQAGLVDALLDRYLPAD